MKLKTKKQLLRGASLATTIFVFVVANLQNQTRLMYYVFIGSYFLALTLVVIISFLAQEGLTAQDELEQTIIKSRERKQRIVELNIKLANLKTTKR